MKILENISLSNYSTMRLGGPARYLTEVTSNEELVDAVDWSHKHDLPTMMIGNGSNIIWGDRGYEGLVIVNKLMGFDIQQQDKMTGIVIIGAGENWDESVKRTVELGYSGIEQLSLIPGTAGATPIQNVGAYGREIKDVLISLKAYDIKKEKFIILKVDECNFGYRTSRFKTADKDRFLITSITLRLSKTEPTTPFYEALQKYLETHNIQRYTSQIIRNAVIDIRSSKLPDPAIVANTGSFFFNPIVDKNIINELLSKYPKVPHWAVSEDSFKISAAWLVENAGYKDFHDLNTGMATWPKHPLVLVNEHATSTADLLSFRDQLASAVEEQFGISLKQEPVLIT